jgi:hypothetical protein
MEAADSAACCNADYSRTNFDLFYARMLISQTRCMRRNLITRGRRETGWGRLHKELGHIILRAAARIGVMSRPRHPKQFAASTEIT